LNSLRFIDLFAGIGGFRIGFNQAGYQCVYSCEIDPSCQEVYKRNFNEIPFSDITKINIESIPDFEVLTAGFPCQPFSICGKRKGFEDTRGTLFFHICQILEAKQPPFAVLENVKYLIYHDGGKTLKVILESLEDIGYYVNYALLNSKDFGVPQNRERLVIIASKKQLFNFKKLPIIRPIPKLKEFLSENEKFDYLLPDEYTLIDNPKYQQSGLMFVGYRTNKTIWKKGVRPNTEHLSRVHHQPNRIYSVAGVHPTIPSQETSGRFFIYIPSEDKVRKLTITECYKIMGFPDNFKPCNILGSSYKQIGNSVCVPMIYQIAQEIQKELSQTLIESPQTRIFSSKQLALFN
jgi:DNA (cytosine-5)-methyltransferase 1